MKSSIIALIIGCTIFGLIIYYSSVYIPEQMKRNGIILHAQTLYWTISSKSGYQLKYRFSYENKEHIGFYSSKNINGNNDFIYKNFPVIFDPNTNSSELLIFPNDFKEFNLIFPDSLKWALDYIE